MPLASYAQPKFAKHLANKNIDLVTATIDTLKVGLIASGTLAARSVTENYEFVSDLLANSGSALTEVSTSGTNYARQNLTSVTYTQSGLAFNLGAANPSWVAAAFTAIYGWVHDETASSATDATRPLLLIWDFGGAYVLNPFTIVLTSGVLASWTAGQ